MSYLWCTTCASPPASIERRLIQQTVFIWIYYRHPVVTPNTLSPDTQARLTNPQRSNSGKSSPLQTTNASSISSRCFATMSDELRSSSYQQLPTQLEKGASGLAVTPWLDHEVNEAKIVPASRLFSGVHVHGFGLYNTAILVRHSPLPVDKEDDARKWRVLCVSAIFIDCELDVLTANSYCVTLNRSLATIAAHFDCDSMSGSARAEGGRLLVGLSTS